MFNSLPQMLVHHYNSTWLGPPRAQSPPPTNAQSQQEHRRRQLREEERKANNARSSFAILLAEQAAIERREAAIRNFGSQWIRPPGVPKTLQAMNEEALEREEQAELERQEAGMRDLQAQQQLAEAQAQAQETAAADQEVDGEVEEERDLDAEIPYADDSTADVTFNEDSLVEGSQLELNEQEGEQYVELEEAELTGAARDVEDLGLERDLDESVPEAGSYQHTDTEVEDTDSESELQNSFLGRTSTSQVPSTRTEQRQLEPLQLMERMRAQVSAADGLQRSPGSLNLSSSILDSSLVGSSPVMQRTTAGGNRNRGGRARRGRRS